jgi:hypothetical protein
VCDSAPSRRAVVDDAAIDHDHTLDHNHLGPGDADRVERVR